MGASFNEVNAFLVYSLYRSELSVNMGFSPQTPECSRQRLSGPTRHVGQGTELNSSGDMSLILMVILCNKTHPGHCSNWHTPRNRLRRPGSSRNQANPQISGGSMWPVNQALDFQWLSSTENLHFERSNRDTHAI
jgi:hypothetical protein